MGEASRPSSAFYVSWRMAFFKQLKMRSRLPAQADRSSERNAMIANLANFPCMGEVGVADLLRRRLFVRFTPMGDLLAHVVCQQNRMLSVGARESECNALARALE